MRFKAYSVAIMVLAAGIMVALWPVQAEAYPVMTPQLILLGTFNSTGYCPCKKCCGKWARYKKTTAGHKAQGPLIAVDPSHIPLGSEVYVEGYGWKVASDTGGDIKGRRIDVLYPNHYRAKRHGGGKGKQRVRVWVRGNPRADSV